MSEKKVTSNHKMEKTGGYQPVEKGLQPSNVSNVGKPPSGGSNVKGPVNKK